MNLISFYDLFKLNNIYNNYYFMRKYYNSTNNYYCGISSLLFFINIFVKNNSFLYIKFYKLTSCNIFILFFCKKK